MSLSLHEKAAQLTPDRLIKIDRVENHRLKECVKILHSHVFPVQYGATFFDAIYENNYHGMNLICLFNGILVGIICARLEEDKDAQQAGAQADSRSDVAKLASSFESMALDAREGQSLPLRCYIMTLGVLPHYRRLGIASKLLHKAMENLQAFVAKKNADAARSDPKHSGRKPKVEITEVRLHVQVSNAAGLDFYKAQGFDMHELVEDYYTAVEPRGAYLLTRPFASFTAKDAAQDP